MAGRIAVTKFSTLFRSRRVAARGSAHGRRVGGAEAGRAARRDLPGRSGRGAPPPAGRGQPGKPGRGHRPAEQRPQRSCPGSRAAHSEGLSPPPSISALLRSPGARTGSGYRTKRPVTTRPNDTWTIVREKLTRQKEVAQAHFRPPKREGLSYQLSLPDPNASL